MNKNIKEEKVYFKSYRFENIKEAMEYSFDKYSDNYAFIIKTKDENLKSRYENDNHKFNSLEYLSIKYSEVLKDAKLFAKYLLENGYGNKNEKGERLKIGVISKNRYEWILTYLASIFSGILIVPFDKSLTKSEFLNSVNIADIDIIVYEKEYADYINELEDVKKVVMNYEEKNDKLFTIYDAIDSAKNLEKALNENDMYKLVDDVKIDNNQTSALLFTSGTTSKSKVVELSQSNIVSNLVDIKLVEDINEKDNTLAFLPYHHSFGSTGQLAMLYLGITTAYCDGIRYIAKNLSEYNCTMFIGVPALVEGIYRNIWREIKKQKKEKLIQKMIKVSNILLKMKIDIRRILFKKIIDKIGGLRIIISGASGLDPIVHKGLINFGIDTIQGYGLTETSPIIAAENYKEKRIGSVGKAFPSSEIIISEKDENGIGEILVKGKSVMKGYYKNPEATNEVFKDGWFRTGDLGYIDNDGYIFITGRQKNVIVLKNGKNIYPEEIEEKLKNIDLIEECFVFGMPDGDDLKLSIKAKYNKEAIKTFYQEKTEDELYEMVWEKVKEVNKELPQYKYIKKLYISHDEFIKSSTNKIKRFEEIKKIMEDLK